MDHPDYSLLTRPRLPDYLWHPMPPMLLPPSRVLDARFGSLPAMQFRFDHEPTLINLQIIANEYGVPVIGQEVLEEAFDLSMQIIGDAQVYSCTSEFCVEHVNYGQNLVTKTGAVGIHADYLSHFPNFPAADQRAIHIVIAAPFSTIAFIEMYPVGVQIYASWHERTYAPDENNPDAGPTLIPPPGQWMALQEGTPHTAPKLDAYVPDRATAAARFAQNAEWLSYLHAQHYTRLFASLDIIFAAKAAPLTL